MSFNPIEASKKITDEYISYLKTIFKIADADYEKKFIKCLEKKNNFAKGPYIELSGSFAKGKSLNELIAEKVLDKNMSKVSTDRNRKLYLHQEKAIKKAVQKRNVIVSTGTGSGKTFCYLVPIFNELSKQLSEGNLTSGVRALIIFPMNALANDQLNVLRELLKNYPEITFGSYTGLTAERRKDALIDYKDRQKGTNFEEPLKNELISREEMKKNPPHILVTNYSMLEYLMLRPKDSVLFNNDGNGWKYVVLDEAHTYQGATGIEVSMLIRRLKESVKTKKINFILTSATLGGKDSDEDIAKFGKNLCGEEFTKEDIIKAQKIVENDFIKINISRNDYQEIANILKKDDFNDYEYDINIKKVIGKENSSIKSKELLYDLLKEEENFINIKKCLKEKSRTIDEVAKYLGKDVSFIDDVITVAMYAEKDGSKLLNPRFHMFLKATDSVFITLPPQKRVFLERKPYHKENGEEYKVFEIAVCSRCNAIYLVGVKDEDNRLNYSSFNDDKKKYEKYLLTTENNPNDYNDNESDEDQNVNGEICYICSKCGKVVERNECISECEHSKKDYVKVYRVNIENKNDNTVDDLAQRNMLRKCISCGESYNQGSILKFFFTGQDEVTSFIGTSLYESLPSYKYEVVSNGDTSIFGGSKNSITTNKINLKKQFLSFSDSRQSAAYFATYLNNYHNYLLNRRITVEVLKNVDLGREKGLSFNHMLESLRHQFDELYPNNKKGLDIDAKCYQALLYELIHLKKKNSLFRLGIMSYTLNTDKEKLNYNDCLSNEDGLVILDVLVGGFLNDAAIYYKKGLNKEEKSFFLNNLHEGSFTKCKGNDKFSRPFLPVNDFTNKRIDYLKKILSIYINDQEKLEKTANEMLKYIWDLIEKSYLHKQEDNTYRLDADKLRLYRPKKLYRCSKCKKITPFNVHDICPEYKCDGKLEEIPSNYFKDDAYYKKYHNLEKRNLLAKEHTAQLISKQASNYQREFENKDINVLSCSTTFEMGVDLGDLQTVFMRNMPPSPANYTQRAGRAGRGKDSAAYAITFCNRASHDFYYFDRPVEMIKGDIKAPKFNINNEKIALRHIFSVALSKFWKTYPNYFSNVEGMFSSDEKSGMKKFEQYLNNKPVELKESLLKIFPEHITKYYDIENFGWLSKLFNENKDNPGILTTAYLELKEELDAIDKAIRQERRKSLDQMTNTGPLIRRKQTYLDENIISFLSKNNVIPKYGFPVDNIKLEINDKKNASVDLDRDLSIAISEYAPGSEVVADDKIYTSRYIKKVKNLGWKIYDYAECSQCGTVTAKVHTGNEEEQIIACQLCHNPFTKKEVKTYIIPSFGFKAEDKTKVPNNDTKPQKVYSGETFYLNKKNVNTKKVSFLINGFNFTMISSESDSLATISTASFYVCPKCGYAIRKTNSSRQGLKTTEHKCFSDQKISNRNMKDYKLGNTFETDALQIKFEDIPLKYKCDHEKALSLLYALIIGASRVLSIYENDIYGCLNTYYSKRNCYEYSFILYDTTPGGAGHVKRINKDNIEEILKKALDITSSCNCGGENGDSSCYHCLRMYRNQRHHDQIKRKYVKEILSKIV